MLYWLTVLFVITQWITKATSLGVVHEIRPQSGRGLSSADIFRTRGEGVLLMRKSALFGEKHFGFFEIYSVSARTR